MFEDHIIRGKLSVDKERLIILVMMGINVAAFCFSVSIIFLFCFLFIFCFFLFFLNFFCLINFSINFCFDRRYDM